MKNYILLFVALGLLTASIYLLLDGGWSERIWGFGLCPVTGLIFFYLWKNNFLKRND